MAANTKITEIVEFNPARPVKRGTIAPFVDMAALPENQRDIAYILKREFTGGGSRFQNGDTLFARITPCLENGKTAKVNILPAGKTAHGSTEFIVMAAKAPKYDEDYVYYLARHPEFRAFAEARMEGTSGRQRVSWQALSEFTFAFPSPDRRIIIGSILRKIDDKIDLNRRINQTLEVMAQAIFKSWFVDFDPVKAKIAAIEQGQDPLRAAMRTISGKTDTELDQMPPEHHDQLAATAALFPDVMEDTAQGNANAASAGRAEVASKLGEIPKGWSFRQIAEFGEVVCGKTPAKSNPEYFGFGTPFIKIPDMHDNVYVTQPSEQLTLEGVASQPKKTIPPGSICVSCIATVGKVVLTHEFSQTNQQINSIIPRRSEYGVYLYFQMLEKQRDFHDLASGGSATLNMNTSTFSKVETLLPDDGVVTRFSKLAEPIFSQILANQKQADNLATLRDTLLPKLLCGELSIGNIPSEDKH